MARPVEAIKTEVKFIVCGIGLQEKTERKQSFFGKSKSDYTSKNKNVKSNKYNVQFLGRAAE